jgi:hypothetical protein
LSSAESSISGPCRAAIQCWMPASASSVRSGRSRGRKLLDGSVRQAGWSLASDIDERLPASGLASPKDKTNNNDRHPCVVKRRQRPASSKLCPDLRRRLRFPGSYPTIRMRQRWANGTRASVSQKNAADPSEALMASKPKNLTAIRLCVLFRGLKCMKVSDICRKREDVNERSRAIK